MSSNVVDPGADKTADTRLDDPVAAEKGSFHGVSSGVICTSEDVGATRLEGREPVTR